MVKIRGIEFQSNTDNDMGLEFYNLSHRYGFKCPNWPYFRDVQIERTMARDGCDRAEAERRVALQLQIDEFEIEPDTLRVEHLFQL